MKYRVIFEFEASEYTCETGNEDKTPCKYWFGKRCLAFGGKIEYNNETPIRCPQCIEQAIEVKNG